MWQWVGAVVLVLHPTREFWLLQVSMGEEWAFPGQMGVGSVSYARSMPPFFCSQEQTLAAPFLDLSRPIGTALVLPWRKEKASPSPQQQPNPYAGFRLSQPVLLQCKSELCTHF